MNAQVTTTVKNSLTKSDDIESVKMSAYLTVPAIKDRINQMIGGQNGVKFISAIVSAVSTNPSLEKCTNTSIFNAALVGESLKLAHSPQLGHYYLVPYDKKDKHGNVLRTEAQFQIGYKGYIQLAKRSGVYKRLNVVAIKEGELVKYDPLNEEIIVNLIQNDLEREKTKTIGYYAMFEEIGGFRKSLYWSKEKMMTHADKYSQAFSIDSKIIKGNYGDIEKVSFADYELGKIKKGTEWLYSSFWYKDFDQMAFKTMLRQLISKWGTMSIEFQSAVSSDMAVIREDGQASYVENHDFEETPMLEAQVGPENLEEPEIIEAQTSTPKQQKLVEDPEDPFKN